MDFSPSQLSTSGYGAYGRNLDKHIGNQHDCTKIWAAIIFGHENFCKTIDTSKESYHLNKLFLDSTKVELRCTGQQLTHAQIGFWKHGSQQLSSILLLLFLV